MAEYTYDCFTFKQRVESNESPEICLFHAPVEQLLQWADIDRLETRPGGAQRSRNTTKVRSVHRFLEDTANTIPTAVVLAIDLPNNATKEDLNGYTRIRFEYDDDQPKPGIVIDGQHRLLGMREFDPNIHVNVAAILTKDPNEAAFQFLIINNKAARVPTDHIRALLAERDNPRLKQRLDKARLSIGTRYTFVSTADIDPESPFYNQVDWPTNREGEHVVKPQAIETSIRSIQDRKIRQFEDDETVIEFFFTVWRTIKSIWPDLWNADSSLLTKVGIICLTEYVTNSMVGSYDLGTFDLTNMDAVERRVRELLSYQSETFWTLGWPAKGYDTTAGRHAILDALIQISRNLREGLDWFEEVDVLSEADLDQAANE